MYLYFDLTNLITNTSEIPLYRSMTVFAFSFNPNFVLSIRLMQLEHLVRDSNRNICIVCISSPNQIYKSHL